MDTLNERIKILRNKLGMSQKDFAGRLGISQRSVSWGEQPGNNVPDSTVKSICMAFNVDENWLRTGTGNMYIESSKFSLNEFVVSKGATELDLDVMKAYFELDPEIRHTVIEHFKRYLSNPHALYESVPENPETLESECVQIDDAATSDVG